MRYALINEHGVCFSDSHLAGEVDSPRLIPLDEGDPSPLGKKWTGIAWEVLPESEPAPIRTLTKLQFRNRFTTEEKVALYTAAETNVLIRVFLDDVAAAQEIDLDYPATVEGVHALEALGIIGEGRATEILA